MMRLIRCLPLLLLTFAVAADAQISYRDVPVAEDHPVPRMPGPSTLENTPAEQFQPGWPEAPPVIPHAVNNYQINLNANRCLTCHKPPGETAPRVPSISPTHYFDRQGNATETLAPRRYFCMQCHVPQHRTRLSVDNTFRGDPR